MEKKKQIDYSIWIYVIFGAFSVWPLTCDYILQGADVNYWVARMEEMYQSLMQGTFLLMPSQDLLVSFWSEGSGINTNLWLLVPVLCRVLGLSIVDSYRLFLLCSNLVTVAGAVWMMNTIVEKKLARIAGVALFVLCPYRVYFCYDNPDFGKMIVWMLLPYTVGALVRMVRNHKSILYMIVVALSLAGMLYSDAVTAIFVIGICALMILWSRTWRAFIAVGGSLVLFLPAAVPFTRYIVKGIYLENYLPLGSIMGNGYTLGKILSSYMYESGKPGLGLGVMMAVFLLVWLIWCNEKAMQTKWIKPVGSLAGVCVLSCLQYFPWDYVMRLGTPFLRLIGLLESPVVFLGLAGSMLSVLGAAGVEEASDSEEPFVAWIVPIAIIIATLGVYFYLCSGLIEGRNQIVF